MLDQFLQRGDRMKAVYFSDSAVRPVRQGLPGPPIAHEPDAPDLGGGVATQGAPIGGFTPRDVGAAPLEPPTGGRLHAAPCQPVD